MNNLNEDKELLQKIYFELESGKSVTEERKEELIQIISNLESRFNDDIVKNNTFIELKNKLNSIEIQQDEISVKNTVLDIVKGAMKAVTNALTSMPWLWP